MEVDDSRWVPLPPPGEPNQPNTTMPQLPIIPMHMALNECNTTYPMLPKGFHRSRVDNTVHVGAAAKAAQQNEALGVMPPRSTMQPADCGFPQMVKQWEDLLRSTRKTGNITAVCVVRGFVTQAQNTHALQRAEPQCQALKGWTYPDWFKPPLHKGKECTVPKSNVHLALASPGQALSRSPDRTVTSALQQSQHMFPDLPPPHEDRWQPRHPDEVHVSMPRMRDVPKLWAKWIDQHLDKCPRGILIKLDGRVSMRSIHGMQLIKQRNPHPQVVERQRTQFLFMSIRLFTSPWAYWEAQQRLHMTVVNSRLCEPYDGSIDNLTVDALAHFYAAQGVTQEEANDVFEYAYQWLTIAATEQASQSAEIQSLLGEVNLAIREAGNKPPPINGVQWWQLQFTQPAQLYAGSLPADQHAALIAKYGPFNEPVEDSQPNPYYVATIEASRHQSVASDTVLLGHTSPKSSTGPPASRPVTRTTDPDFEMESGVAPSVPPAGNGP
jgi:hypothetical protein